MLQLTDDQIDEVVSIEQSMNDCRDNYLEAIKQFNEALRDAFFSVEKAAEDYLDTCERAEVCRDSIAKDLERRVAELPKKVLKTPEGVKLLRWVEAWELMDLQSECMPDQPEDMDQPDFKALDKFANIPFGSAVFV